jgi:predicted GNAT family N-acyltransferase
VFAAAFHRRRDDFLVSAVNETVPRRFDFGRAQRECRQEEENEPGCPRAPWAGGRAPTGMMVRGRKHGIGAKLAHRCIVARLIVECGMCALRVSFREIAVGSLEHTEALALRESVLRTPLGLRWTAEELADEGHCTHLAAFANDQLVATLVLKPLEARTVKMRQVAVKPSLRRSGIGAGLVKFAEDFARTRGFDTMTAHARETVVPFYVRLGYAVIGDPFEEVTIPHRAVTKALRPAV